MARWKAHDRLSIRVNWTFFAIYYGSGVMKRNVYNSAVFTGANSVSVSCCLATSKIQTRFCSCDLELDLDLDIRTWPLHTKMKFLGQNFQQLELEQDRQTDRQTDRRTDGRTEGTELVNVAQRLNRFRWNLARKTVVGSNIGSTSDKMGLGSYAFSSKSWNIQYTTWQSLYDSHTKQFTRRYWIFVCDSFDCMRSAHKTSF